MNTNAKSLVSVVTPVYNCGPYLKECIESVLKQTYGNWEYIIVNNRSTDNSLEIAERYCKMDKRIRVHTNDQFLDIISNHNKAFQLISSESKYCKVVSGDDWIFPECLERMVTLADANPSIGIVGCYQLSGAGETGSAWRIKWTEVPYSMAVIPGRDICRSQLLGGPYVFGTPTSLMYRADLVRATDSFYPNLTAEADTSACYKHLQNTDFGFVHQVISYERVHVSQISTTSRGFHKYKSSHLSDLLAYGSLYLSQEELQARLKVVLDDYYCYLALNVLDRRDKEFWNYHKKRMGELGHPVSATNLAGAVLRKGLELAMSPRQTVKNLGKRLRAG